MWSKDKAVFYISLFIALFLFSNQVLALNNEKIPANEFISVKTFGAKGDGQSNDAVSIENTMIFCIKNNKTCFIPKTSKFYNIASTIRVSLNAGESLIITSNGAIIKPLSPPVNKSAYNLTLFKEHIFLSVGKQIDSLSKKMFSRSTNTRIKVSGLVFDGVLLKEQFATATFDTDVFIGLQALADNVIINNCLFRNIYGYGMRIHNVKFSTITNTKFENVGGRGATLFAQNTDKDALGDGIYHALVKPNGSIKISDCTFKGKKVQNKRSRSAITFEYSTEPYKIKLTKLTIAGFAKCVHIEEISPTVVHIEHVNMLDFNLGIANVINNKSTIFLKKVNMEIGTNDGNESGDALAFLNYQSKAKIYIDSSYLNFKGRKEAYQSAVGLVKVQNSTINANKTNFFFADGSTVFDNCKFVGFGGKTKSFFSNNGESNYQILNSRFENSSTIYSENIKHKININRSNFGLN